MVQRRSLAWTELRVGIIVIVSFLLLAVAIFFIGGQTGFFGPKYTILAYFQNANNLRTGAEVHLEGVTIGNVNAVRISKMADPQKRLKRNCAWTRHIKISFARILGSRLEPSVFLATRLSTSREAPKRARFSKMAAQYRARKRATFEKLCRAQTTSSPTCRYSVMM